jgi:hypothetical protein
MSAESQSTFVLFLKEGILFGLSLVTKIMNSRQWDEFITCCFAGRGIVFLCHGGCQPTASGKIETQAFTALSPVSHGQTPIIITG